MGPLEKKGVSEIAEAEEYTLSLGEGKSSRCFFFFFFMETKQTVDEMRNIQVELHYDSMLAVLCVRKADGLAILWKAHVDIHVQTYSLNHIDARIMTDTSSPWRVTSLETIASMSLGNI